MGADMTQEGRYENPHIGPHIGPLISADMAGEGQYGG